MMLSACDPLTHVVRRDWRSRGKYESSPAWLRQGSDQGEAQAEQTVRREYRRRELGRTDPYER